MFVILALFVIIPIIEIYVAVLVGHAIGALNTIGLLILLSVAGVWLTKHEGLGVISRIRRQLESGHMPTNELIDGGLVLAGGIMLILPGFVTAAFGLLLLFPPTRVVGRAVLKKRFQGRVRYFGGTAGFGGTVGFGAPPGFGNPPGGRIDGPDDIIDV